MEQSHYGFKHAVDQELMLRGSRDFESREGYETFLKEMLVQKLLSAKVKLRLEKELRRLDKYEALIIDDMGYVQQSREEVGVLLTLQAHRYGHRSVMITSNLVFSQWGKIFKDPMTTASASSPQRDPRAQHRKLPHGHGQGGKGANRPQLSREGGKNDARPGWDSVGPRPPESHPRRVPNGR